MSLVAPVAVVGVDLDPRDLLRGLMEECLRDAAALVGTAPAASAAGAAAASGRIPALRGPHAAVRQAPPAYPPEVVAVARDLFRARLRATGR